MIQKTGNRFSGRIIAGNILFKRYRGRDGESDAVRGQHARKFIRIEIGEFPLALVGERIEPLELGIDEAGMAHDQPAVRQPGQKTREDRGEVGLAA